MPPVVSPFQAYTFYWQGFPGPAGYLDIPEFSRYPIDNGVNPINKRDQIGFAYLLRVTFPNENDLSSENYETIYIAASFGRSVHYDDVPANKYVPGSLLGSTINYQFNAFSGIEPEANASGGLGAIVLVDPRGDLDYLVNKSWDEAKLDILRGSPYDYFNTYQVVGKLTTAGILYDQRKKEIRLRDQAWMLQQAGLHDQIYDGEGGLGGDEVLTGVYKPYRVGPCFNCAPVVINAVAEIRQLSFTSIQAIDDVRDGGVSLIATGIDYPDYAALEAAAVGLLIPASHYSTCLAQGLFALGSKPVFTVTADFRGDANVINGTGYPDTLAEICRRIVTGYGNVKMNDSDIDFASLNRVSQSQPATSGWWWKEHSTKADALQRIMRGRLGIWGVRLNGLVAFGVVTEPIGSPAMIVTYPVDFTGEPGQMDTYQVPRRATYVSHSTNYTPQDASQLAGTVIDSGDALIFSQPSSWSHEQHSNLPDWLLPTSQIWHMADSGMISHPEADAEAIRQQRLMGKRRERWKISVPFSPFSDVVGKIVQIDGFPRYGWGASKKFICVGISFASGIAVTLDLWG